MLDRVAVLALVLATTGGCDGRNAPPEPAALGRTRASLLGAVLHRSDPRLNGNHHPLYQLTVQNGDVTYELGEGLDAAILADTMVVVRANETLHVIERDGRTRPIATDVLPDLAVDPAGARLAFVRRSGDGSVIELLEHGTTRTLVSAFAEADRPLFVGARTLVFVGTPTPGISTFHRVGLDGHEAPVRIAPDAPLPASRDGYAFVGGLVRYHDGTQLRSVDPGPSP